MKILDDFPERAARKTKYPWAEWFDGKIRLLEQGKDYVIATSSFRVVAVGQAIRMGGKARSAKHKNGLVIQFICSVIPTNKGERPT